MCGGVDGLASLWIGIHKRKRNSYQVFLRNASQAVDTLSQYVYQPFLAVFGPVGFSDRWGLLWSWFLELNTSLTQDLLCLSASFRFTAHKWPRPVVKPTFLQERTGLLNEGIAGTTVLLNISVSDLAVEVDQLNALSL